MNEILKKKTYSSGNVCVCVRVFVC